jgi:hypothetical protein
MRSLLVFLVTIMLASATTAQTHYIPSTPRLSNDWRAGFFNSTDLNYGFGLRDVSVPYSKYFYGLTTVTGYQFNRSVKAGLGLGAYRFNGGMFWPLYMHFRYSIWAQHWVPYIYADGGYMFNFTDVIDESRFFANPGIGIHYIAHERLAINLSAGLFHHSGGSGGRSSFINFKLGIEFKGRAWNQFMIIK